MHSLWTRVGIGVIVAVALAACGASSETASSTGAGDAPAASLASLTVISTDVTVEPAGKERTAGSSGRGLEQGDTVRTDANGFASISFSDGSLARVEHDAEFVLTALAKRDAVTETRTRLVNGDSWHHVEPLTDQGDSYQVDTPVASATVRGTAFAINCTGGTRCTFAVVEGTVELRTPAGVTLSLTAGQRITLEKEQPPPAVEAPGVPQLEQDPWISRNRTLDATSGTPGTTSTTATETASGASNGPSVTIKTPAGAPGPKEITEELFYSMEHPDSPPAPCNEPPDLAGCPATAELKAAFIRHSAGEPGAQIQWVADPVCRCQNSFPVTYVYPAPMPAALQGQPGYAVVEAILGVASQGATYSVFVVVRQQPDGTWLAADTYCAAHAGDPDPYGNRMTGNPTGCAG